MRYFLQRLITRGDYESAVILAKNNDAWLPPELLNQEELSPLNLIYYRLVRTNKVWHYPSYGWQCFSKNDFCSLGLDLLKSENAS